MRLLETERERVASVAERWKHQYFTFNGWFNTISGDSEQIYLKLKELPETATAEDVAAIIGHSWGWIGIRCSECGEHTAVVLVGDEPDCESDSVFLCKGCVVRLFFLLYEVTQEVGTPIGGGDAKC